MVRRLRTMRPVAAAMMFALVAMLSASCLAAENMTPAQKACCAAMNHDCGQMAITEGCCAGHAREDGSLSPANRIETAAPPLPVLVAALDVQEPLSSAQHLVTAASATPVKPPGTSTYLFVSSFRL
jgi:hypothetical protein